MRGTREEILLLLLGKQHLRLLKSPFSSDSLAAKIFSTETPQKLSSYMLF